MPTWSDQSSNSFFFNDTATTEIYTLSLHDALPIFSAKRRSCREWPMVSRKGDPTTAAPSPSRKLPLRAAGLCTTLCAWTREGAGLEGLLQRPLRAPAAGGAPFPDGQVLDAAREGRRGGHLRTRRNARAPPGLGRGDIARP